ncbi:MAG TPA: tetratricopeptide repeat protein, partial [Vicinamibacterales bacterium]|nr:tetratricopeptide repeat protein [Vicinamibacterales bacterium]
MQQALVVLLLLLVATQQPAPPAQTPPGIPEAIRLQATDPAGAAKILEGVTAREPQNARAWRLFGVALQQAEQFDRAIEAYQKSRAIGPDPTSTYNIGISYLRKKDVDKAFTWLAVAKAAKYDVTQMLVDTNLELLRTDPRYVALLLKKADFEKPFVEDTKILGEWTGEAANDQFGWIARGAGDLDKDGVTDFVTSAPFKGDPAQPSGRVYAYSTKSRRLLWKVDGAPGDQLGITLETAGDLNADGTPDVVATGGGRAHVYSGTDGKVLVSLASPGTLPILAASTAGDVNRDGHADIITGANPRPPSGPPAAGQTPPAPVPGNAYVFSGKDGKLLLTLEGERPGDRFGGAVAGHVD